MTEPGTRGTIPLFPLGSVLFPGLLLPLNIFEPRYRALVADLEQMDDDERRFGVVCIREGVEVGETGIKALHQVGCTAEVHRIVTGDDGRSEVVSVGGHRFVLLEVDTTSHPYATAKVEWLAESAESPDDDPGAADLLVDVVVAQFGRYVEALESLRNVQVELPDLPQDARTLSYLVSATTLCDLADRQALLSAPSDADRLRGALALLRRETVLVGRFSAMPAPELARGGWNPN